MNDMTIPNRPKPPAPLSDAQIREYLEFDTERMRARRDDLIAALAASAAAYPQIDDDEVLGEVSENIALAKKLNTAVEERRKRAKEPFLAGGRTVDSWFKIFVEPLADAIRPVQARMNDYARRKLEKAEAERKAAAAAAQAEADRLAAQAAEKIAAGKRAGTAMDLAETAATKAAQATAAAQASVADMTRIRGDYGSAVSARRTWRWVIEDDSLIPREFLMANPAAIGEAARERDATGRPLAVIPGIRWECDVVMGVRG
jgi:hypothetical protein